MFDIWPATMFFVDIACVFHDILISHDLSDTVSIMNGSLSPDLFLEIPA